MSDESHNLLGMQAGRALAALLVAYYHSYMLFNGWQQDYVLAIPALKQHGYLGVNFFLRNQRICDQFRLRQGWVYATRISDQKVFQTLSGLLGGHRLNDFPETVCFPTRWKLQSRIYCLFNGIAPQSGTPFYPVTWSLEYELMFYALAVLVVPFFSVWVLAAVLFGLVRWALTAPPDFFTFHLVATLNSDFLAGVLAYLLRKPMSYIPPTILVAAGLFGYYTVAVVQVPFSGSVGGFLLVSGLIGAKWGWDRAPLKWLVSIGDASYSLYLIHFILIFVSAAMFNTLRLPPTFAEPVRFIYLAICVWLSLQMWKRIEKPMIDLGNKISLRWTQIKSNEVPLPSPH